MSDDGGAGEPLSGDQKREIAVWFLANAPTGEIHYVAKDVRALLGDDAAYEAAAAEAYPEYNKTQLVSLELPDRSGDIIITAYGEIDRNNYLDPRTAQIATVDHVKQTCTKLRPATDEELPSGYIEEFRNAIDYEVSKYVGEAYPKGVCAVYCTNGKDLEEPGADFGLAVVISAARRSPRNFCNGSWRSIWTLEFSYAFQLVEIKGKIQVDAHYFEEGNVQLDTDVDCKDSTIMQNLVSYHLKHGLPLSLFSGSEALFWLLYHCFSILCLYSWTHSAAIINYSRLKTLDTQSLASFSITNPSIFHLSRNHT
ncbi:hypothetical protein ACQJBY_018987 [Aegilops geniculata]